MQNLTINKPNLMPYFDVHTHRRPRHSDVVCVRNAYHFLPRMSATNMYYSMGVHPWMLSKYYHQSVISKLKELAKHPKVVAIGEIGLDKLKPNLSLQEAAFLVQTDIAKDAALPIILHCVKAYETLLPLLKNFPQAAVMHNFYTSKEMCSAYLKLPNAYFSLGKNFFLANGLNQAFAKAIPLERIFVESDQGNIDMRLRYVQLANFYGIEPKVLEAQINENALKVFKRLGPV